MYRAGLEFILGFGLRGERLTLDPCIPRSWREYEINYRYGSSRYQIKVENPYGMSRGIASVEVDGELQPSDDIPLKDDGARHTVRVVLGERPPTDERRSAETAQASSSTE
jgi:cyclic beta-1,2-glucan synthetase